MFVVDSGPTSQGLQEQILLQIVILVMESFRYHLNTPNTLPILFVCEKLNTQTDIIQRRQFKSLFFSNKSLFAQSLSIIYLCVVTYGCLSEKVQVRD